MDIEKYPLILGQFFPFLMNYLVSPNTFSLSFV